LIQEAAFEPETIVLLAGAYDSARHQLGDVSPAVLEVLAKRIILAAGQGERDPQALTAYALRGLDGTR
jgi:hypothetical protein